MNNASPLIRRIIHQLTQLNPKIEISPANDSDIERIKSLFPKTPELLFQLLKQCNGTGIYPFFPTALELMNTEQIIDGFGSSDGNLQETVDIDEFEEFDDAIKPIFFNPKQLILANCNYDCFWLMDFDPAPKGLMGQIIYQDVESGILKVIAPSLDKLLEAYCRDLEAHQFIFDEEDNAIFLQSGEDWKVQISC